MANGIQDLFNIPLPGETNIERKGPLNDLFNVPMPQVEQEEPPVDPNIAQKIVITGDDDEYIYSPYDGLKQAKLKPGVYIKQDLSLIHI